MKSSTQLLSSALAAALSLGAVSQALAQDKVAKEKCYGIAKAGQNDCANLSGSHSCAGQSKADMAAEDWKYVNKGSCKDMKGMTAEEVQSKMMKK